MSAQGNYRAKLRQLRDERNGATRRKLAETQKQVGGDVESLMQSLVPDADQRAAILTAAKNGNQARAMQLAQDALVGAQDPAAASQVLESPLAGTASENSADEEAPPESLRVDSEAGESSDEEAPPEPRQSQQTKDYRPRCEQQGAQRRCKRHPRKVRGRRSRR